MRLTDVVTQKVIRRLINNQDYRVEVLALINAAFLQYAIDFFEQIVAAKLRHENVTADWYKAEFLNPKLPTNEIIINSGLNKKTIENSFGSAAKSVVLKVTSDYYDQLYNSIQDLLDQSGEIDLRLTITFRDVSVNLNISESLIVINTLAVKRAQIRGGAWSTVGKQVEKPLMITLCHLFNVSQEYYNLRGLTDEQREVDFFLIDSASSRHRCEVKLMGKGNPESADAVIARNTQIFVADKLSALNKQQLTGRNIKWVELNAPQGYRKLLTILHELQIPAQDFEGDVNQRLDIILKSLFPE